VLSQRGEIDLSHDKHQLKQQIDAVSEETGLARFVIEKDLYLTQVTYLQ